MGNIASDHIKPCNIGTSEQHNRRSPGYLAHINAKNIYVRTDLICQNEQWVSEQMAGRDLQTYYADIGRMVKQKTGRALQTKDRERVDKKTGKKKIIRGSSPIRESCVLIKPDTTMADVQRYAEVCHQRWGITPLQIYIHRDEGHYENVADKASWKPNLHAHIVWDWMDHETGKSLKLNKQDMSDIQDYAAECLGMERGKPKAETGAEHLERNDLVLANQQKKMAANDAKLTEQTQQLSDQQLEIEHRQQEIADKQVESQALDREREQKRQRLNEEHGHALLSAAANVGSGVANVFGLGKFHSAEAENERLRQENQTLKTSVDEEKARLRQSFQTQVEEAATKRTRPLNDALAKQRQQIVRLQQQNTVLQADKAKAEDAVSAMERRYETRLRWRDTALSALGRMLYATAERFRQAVDMILKLLRSPFNVFDGGEAKVIRDGIDRLAKTQDERIAFGNLMVGIAGDLCKPHPSNERFDTACDQVEQIAKGDYDWKIERASQGLGL